MKLKKQEEEIRRRQEEIAKELMASDMSVSSVDEVMVCQAREGQVFVGKNGLWHECPCEHRVKQCLFAGKSRSRGFDVVAGVWW